MNAPLGFLPEARRKGIISKEVDGELLIYDLDRDKAHCLNLTAALVWNNSDGLHSIGELVRVVSRELGATIDEAVIQLAIKQLDRDHLLENSEAFPLPTDLSRRAVVRRLGVAAVLLPLITSISAPTALANVSCVTPELGCAVGGCPEGCTCSSVTDTCVNV
jgi:hypothetical protein